MSQSHWKLVEAEVEREERAAQEAQSQQQQQSGDGQWQNNRGNNRRNGGNGGGGRGKRPPRRPEIFVPDTPETRQHCVDMAMQQIIFQYSVDNLCRDTYFRSFMDQEGYVPLIYLFSYPHIASSCADYYSVLEAISKHELLEASMVNETVRVRKGWDAWLMPNQDGTKGLPLYVKEQVEAAESEAGEQQQQQSVAPVTTNSKNSNRRDRSDSKELSASAPAFVAK
jgi:hypothetical protein